MVRHLAWALGVALLFVPTAPVAAECGQQDPRDKRPAPATPPQSSRPKWWLDPKLRQELGITDQQSASIEQIFQSSIPALRDARRELDQLEAVLSKTIQDNTADLFTVAQQVDKVEAARSAYNKARTLMLYRINLLLTADQRAKVQAMHERDDQRRRQDDRGRQDKSSPR
jgi:Spy/CpxP family protein refolding chaperone